MSNTKLKCIILLSSKSAGSSALQNLICQLPQVNHVAKSRHRENETLYWVNAASILHMPQYNMLDSVVPIEKNTARANLITLLQENVDSYQPPNDDHELIFGGWNLLCERYAPVFFEKSPHHLHQWSALSLINRCMSEYPTIDFLIVGLVRNPMDTIYSRWSGGRTNPEKYQYDWQIAYKNLLEFKKIVKTNMVIIKYEDMVTNPSSLDEIYRFTGNTFDYDRTSYLHRRSLSKWKKDRRYGFQLANEIAELASEYGYDISDFNCTNTPMWPIHRFTSTIRHNALKPFRLLRNTFRTTFNKYKT